MSDDNIETLRAAVVAALLTRGCCAHTFDEDGNDVLALPFMAITASIPRRIEDLRALAVACGLRVEGDVVSDPAEEVERLRQELAVARAALREYAPRCAECDAVASRRVDGYEDKEALRCHECSPSPETHKWSHDVEHAAALRAAGDGR